MRRWKNGQRNDGGAAGPAQGCNRDEEDAGREGRTSGGRDEAHEETRGEERRGQVSYVWNADKAARNLARRDISFEEASTVFDDRYVNIEEDIAHSEGERRFRALGVSERGRVLVVIYIERGAAVRIISARQAEPKERRYYESVSFD